MAVFNAYRLVGQIDPCNYADNVEKTSNIVLTEGVNDYSLSSSYKIFNLRTSESLNLTGIAAPSSGRRVVWLKNVGDEDLVVKHQSASSGAANRITTHTGSDITLTTGQILALVYDDDEAEWVTCDEVPASGFKIEVPTDGAVIVDLGGIWNLHNTGNNASGTSSNILAYRHGISDPVADYSEDNDNDRASLILGSGINRSVRSQPGDTGSALFLLADSAAITCQLTPESGYHR